MPAFRSLAAMQQDGLFNAPRTPVMHEEILSALRIRGEAQSPQCRRAPFRSSGRSLGIAVVESRTHIMQEHIGIGMEFLVAQFRNRGVSRFQRLLMAAFA